MKTRTLVIGDIHGGYTALQQVLERAAVTSADKLIFLGDYVDGWSESCQVIELLMQLGQQQQCLFIRGNHDTWCEEWLKTGEANEVWFRNGGKETMASYRTFEEQLWKKHLQFFESMLNYHIDEHNNLFIHAGYSSMQGPEKETYTSNCYWDRTLWEMALTMDTRIETNSLLYPKRLKLFREIFIGHTPTLHYDVETPMNAINVWNIDTGAGFYGKLTAIDIETKQFWQSDSVKTLYPNEKGRNKN